MAFKVYTKQEVYANFRDDESFEHKAKKEIETTIMDLIRRDFPDVNVVKSGTYWFNFTLRTSSDDGSITDIYRLRTAYNVLVRKATEYGLTEM